MPDDKGKLYLFEALELRGEYDGRISTLRACLPKTVSEDRTYGLFGGGMQSKPAAGVDLAKLSEDLKALEYKRRKLNAAIQQANLQATISEDAEELTLAEALDLRKATGESIKELHKQVASSASVRIIHKEDRDIVEEPPFSFVDCNRELDQARLRFRNLNRALRRASHRTTIDFRDEPT